MSGDACKSRTFRAKLQTLSFNNGNQGGAQNMKSTYPNGCNFEVKRTLIPMKHKSSFIIFVRLFQTGVKYSGMNTTPSSLSLFSLSMVYQLVNAQSLPDL